MIILAIESSCDETAVALVRDGREVLTDQVFSQADLHAIYGGVVPEIASRSHVDVISQLADRALAVTGLTRGDIDAVAVTCAPGLIGALLVGVNFAKSAALALGVPLIPVHHVRGHIAANYIAYPELKPPFVCLAISGGNTLICDVRDYTDLRILGATRDDAAGECFDKTARVLGLPYPGGKPIDDLSKTGDDRKYKLPIGHVDGCQYDMSFSGLKTAVINLAHTAEQKGEPLDKPSLAASFCRAMSESLVPRTMAAVRELGYDKLAVAGGVAANSRIRGDFQAACDAAGIRLFVPPLKLCGDNAAMIGCQAYYEYLRGARAGSELTPGPIWRSPRCRFMGVHDGHRARMKARFVRNGLDNFDDHSVLELLLFYAVPRRDVNELAHALLDHFGTLDAVFEASCEDMMRVPGVGENVATLLTLIPQVGRRYQMAKRRQQTILRSSEDAGNYLVPLYLYERTEVVYLLCLDAKCGLTSCKEVGRGVVNAAEVSVRAIVETALSQKAVSVILSHNHVDAYALPSREDELTTRRIRDALLLVGITLADHIIVCGEDYVSFADSGLL